MAHVAKSNRDFEVQDAARTLVRAEEIRGDKKLMGPVRQELKRQSVAATRAIGKSKRPAGGTSRRTTRRAKRR